MEEKIGLILNSLPDVSICLSVSISHINILYTVVYLVGSSLDAVLKTLQESFQGIQAGFSALGLVLNTSKTKVMCFDRNNGPHSLTWW